MPDFEITVLGGTGGPFEDSTQCFMLSPRLAKGLQSICIDGGVGLGSIAKMLSPFSNTTAEVESRYENTIEPIEKYIDSTLIHDIKRGFPTRFYRLINGPIIQKSMQIYQNIGEYYVTHPHMDHIAGLTINSPVIYESAVQSKKYIMGLKFAIDALSNHVFNDLIWPNLTDKRLGKLILETIPGQQTIPSKTFPEWNIIAFEVYHGKKVSNTAANISSTIYIVTHKKSNNTIVFCGDLEKDHSNTREAKLLNKVWLYLANHIPLKNLKAIVIECSNPLSTDEKRLFGHLSSSHLLDELDILKKKYNDKSGLSNLKIIISHVKMTYSEEDPRLTILGELRTLASKKSGLENVSFSIAVNGYTFTI